MVILIIGGAGFVGSNLAFYFLNKYPKYQIICMDNLLRRGSEINLNLFKESGIKFIHGDVRCPEDFPILDKCDVIIECSAEPSVLAGYDDTMKYIINTNLMGAINCFEYAKKYKSFIIFLSTSRVYPINILKNLSLIESNTRFELCAEQKYPGITNKGISEQFPLGRSERSLYGASKLAAEYILQEYVKIFNLNAVINRCGVIAGPGQFGKIDQGFITLWISHHFWKKDLKYIGFGGKGKQVRDVIHIKDLCELIDKQLFISKKLKGNIYNVGGGKELSLSLFELTFLCEKITSNKIIIKSVCKERKGDIPIFITDSSLVKEQFNWKPQKTINDIINDTFIWIDKNNYLLERVLL